MADKSIWIVRCACGQFVQSPIRKFTCPDCGRDHDLTDWGKADLFHWDEKDTKTEPVAA